MFQRIQKNPKHYALGKDDDQTWEERIDALIEQSVTKLKDTELIEGDDNGALSSTEFGDIMSKVCIEFLYAALLIALSTVLYSPSYGMHRTTAMRTMLMINNL